MIAKGGWDGERLEVLRHLSEIVSDASGHALKFSAFNVNFTVDPWVGIVSPILQMWKLRFKGVKHLKLVRSGWHFFFLLCPPFFSFSIRAREGLGLPVNASVSFFSLHLSACPSPRKDLWSSQDNIYRMPLFAMWHLHWDNLEKHSTCLFRVYILKLLIAFSPERLARSSGR